MALRGGRHLLLTWAAGGWFWLSDARPRPTSARQASRDPLGLSSPRGRGCSAWPVGGDAMQGSGCPLLSRGWGPVPSPPSMGSVSCSTGSSSCSGQTPPWSGLDLRRHSPFDQGCDRDHGRCCRCCGGRSRGQETAASACSSRTRERVNPAHAATGAARSSRTAMAEPPLAAERRSARHSMTLGSTADATGGARWQGRLRLGGTSGCNS